MADKKPRNRIEDFLGALLLIAGLFAFGFLDFKKDDPLVEAGLLAEAGEILKDARHEISVDVDGRDIRITGLADTDAERATLLEGLRGIEGRGKITDELSVLETVAPFRLSVDWPGDKPAVVTGFIPSEKARAALRHVLGDGVDGLQLASGAPDDYWADIATRAVDALVLLDSRQLEITDRQITLSGLALSPQVGARVDAAFEALPEGYEFSSAFKYRDDGTPLRLSANKRPNGMLRMSGKLPDSLKIDAPGIADLPTSPLPAPFAAWAETAETGLSALDALQSGTMTLVGSTVSISGEARSEMALSQAKDRLAGLPENVSVATEIMLVDDGKPFDLTVTFDGQAAVASGKVPADLGLRVQTAFLDHPVTEQALSIANVPAPRHWWQAAAAGLEALAMLEHGTLRVQSDRLVFTGLAFDPAKQNEMTKHLAPLVPKDVEVLFELDFYDDGQPFGLSLSYDGAQVQAGGKVPEGLDAKALARLAGVPVNAQGLITGPLQAPKGWVEAAELAASVVPLLETGVVRLGENEIEITAVVRNPAQQKMLEDRLSALPAGLRTVTTLELLDDGRPIYLELKSNADGVIASGKVPRDLGVKSQSVIFGRPVVAGDLENAEIPARPAWWNAARTGIVALSMLEEGNVLIEPKRLVLQGLATAASQKDATLHRLKGLPEGYDVQADIRIIGAE